MPLIDKEVTDDTPNVSSVVYDSGNNSSSSTETKCVEVTRANDTIYIPAATTSNRDATVTYRNYSATARENGSSVSTDSKKISGIFSMSIVILLIVIVSLIMHIFAMFVMKPKLMTGLQSMSSY